MMLEVREVCVQVLDHECRDLRLNENYGPNKYSRGCQSCPEHIYDFCKGYERGIFSVEEDKIRLQRRINGVVRTIERYGWIDGDHHKAWVINVILKTLLGKEYYAWVGRQDGWDKGIAP